MISRCPSCGAPLEDGSIQCPYCKSRQNVDLKIIHKHTTEVPESKRRCPHCNIYMSTIDLSSSLGPFLIERCSVCYGLFFDPGELEKVLERGVSNAFVIDYALLEKLAEEQRDRRETVKYISCPVCGKLMNRINYGTRSGVVIDSCREHGIWLDAGELKRLFEWTKAGGQMFHQQVTEERKKIEEQQAKRLKGQTTADMNMEGGDFNLFGGIGLPRNPYDFRRHDNGVLDILGDLARFFMRGIR